MRATARHLALVSRRHPRRRSVERIALQRRRADHRRGRRQFTHSSPSPSPTTARGRAAPMAGAVRWNSAIPRPRRSRGRRRRPISIRRRTGARHQNSTAHPALPAAALTIGSSSTKSLSACLDANCGFHRTAQHQRHRRKASAAGFSATAQRQLPEIQNPRRHQSRRRSLMVLDESQFNNAGNPGCLVPFCLSSAGDDVFLLQADTAGNLLKFADRVEFSSAPGA